VRIDVATDIDAPPARVWAVLESVESHVEWMADAERITFRTEQRRGVGTEFECLTRVGPLSTTDVMTVTEWEMERAMGIEHRGVVVGRGRFTFSPLAVRRTRFRWGEELHFPVWMGGWVGELAAKPVLTRIWQANLRCLSARVETSGGPSEGG
jgi:hypothetical protein